MTDNKIKIKHAFDLDAFDLDIIIVSVSVIISDILVFVACIFNWFLIVLKISIVFKFYSCPLINFNWPIIILK